MVSGIPHLRVVPHVRHALGPLKEILATTGSSVVRLEGYQGDFDDYMPSLEPLVDSRRYYDSHHTIADTFALVDAKGLRENAALLAVLGFAMASVPQEVIQQPKPPLEE